MEGRSSFRSIGHTHLLSRAGFIVGLMLIFSFGISWGQTPDVQPRLNAQFWKDSVIAKTLKAELRYSLSALGNPLDPTPQYIFGVPVGGDFTWAGISESLASIEALDGTNKLNEFEIVEYLKPWLLLEAPKASTFSQLFMARTLLSYQRGKGKQFNNNKLWNLFSKTEKDILIDALDFRRSYDVKLKLPAGGRPLNYLAVALLVGAEAAQLGINPDPDALKGLANQCADIIIKSNGVLDDDKNGRGRYDRYGREFNQFTYEALELLELKGIQKKVAPAIRNSNQIWFDMLNPATGYSFPYGRSLQNSWDDTFEQCAFLAEYPELSPIQLPLIVTIYNHAWAHYIKHQYNFTTHLSRMHEPGRGTYSYVSPNRTWFYSVHTFGKIALSAKIVLEACSKSGISSWTIKPELPPVNRWIPINHPDKTRKMGWWIVRNPGNYFVLPCVGGMSKSATSDYLPIPYGFEGVEIPVAQNIPALIPFFTLADGRTLSTSDGADSVALSEDGKSLSLYWSNLVDEKVNRVKDKLQVVSTWTWQDQELVNTLAIKSLENQILHKIQYWVPSSYDQADLISGTLANKDGFAIAVNATMDWNEKMIIASPNHSALGKGAFAAIGLIMQWNADDVPMVKDRTYNFKLTIRKTGF